MTQQPFLPPEGWYPNPADPEQQRWWDGQAWTEHVAVGAPMAPGAIPPAADAAPAAPGYQQPQPYQPTPPGYQPYEATPPGYQGYQGYQPQQPPQQPAYPGYANHPGYPAPVERGVLPDGARVAGWWWRVLARTLDSWLVWIPASLIGLPQWRVIWNTYRTYFDQIQAAADAGQPTPSFQFAQEGAYLRAFLILVIIYAVTSAVYEVLMLKLCSATVGKLICGLRVRPWQQRGPLSWRSVCLRVVTFQLPAGIPSVGGIYVLIDELFPLWDSHKQALHDKAAGTAVVKRRDAEIVTGPGGFGL
jgi:uncharacterized RDD family membrane protein YckC